MDPDGRPVIRISSEDDPKHGSSPSIQLLSGGGDPILSIAKDLAFSSSGVRIEFYSPGGAEVLGIGSGYMGISPEIIMRGSSTQGDVSAVASPAGGLVGPSVMRIAAPVFPSIDTEECVPFLLSHQGQKIMMKYFRTGVPIVEVTGESGRSVLGERR